jgi:hypothetical protein
MAHTPLGMHVGLSVTVHDTCSVLYQRYIKGVFPLAILLRH